MEPTDFWSPDEEAVSSFAQLLEVIEQVFARGAQQGRTFAWRGHVDAGWGLSSALYRRLSWTLTHTPLERDLYRREGEILKEFHQWGLHMTVGTGRLSILNQLANLQHYGAPTRLIDVSFNSWVGAWFAAEQKYSNGRKIMDDVDGRIFAIDVTDSLINEIDSHRAWEDELRRPWRTGHPGSKPSISWSEEQKNQYKDWCAEVVAWRPPHFNGRIAAQNGGFIIGGVPLSTGRDNTPNQWPKRDRGYWSIEDVRKATSVSLHPNKLRSRQGRVSGSAVYTIRVEANAKQEVRQRLKSLFGYEHRTIYPDLPGFAEFGTPTLKRMP